MDSKKVHQINDLALTHLANSKFEIGENVQLGNLEKEIDTLNLNKHKLKNDGNVQIDFDIQWRENKLNMEDYYNIDESLFHFYLKIYILIVEKISNNLRSKNLHIVCQYTTDFFDESNPYKSHVFRAAVGDFIDIDNYEGAIFNEINATIRTHIINNN